MVSQDAGNNEEGEVTKLEALVIGGMIIWVGAGIVVAQILFKGDDDEE